MYFDMDDLQKPSQAEASERPAARPAVSARARPGFVDIVETYEYRLEISKNYIYQLAGPPQGQMTVSVAYDGHLCLTRQALLDIRRQLGVDWRKNLQANALIGHLVFANYERTSIARELGLAGPFNALPLVIPVAGGAIKSPRQLIDDRHAWVAKATYEVEEPKIWPITLEVSLRDENTVSQNVWAPEVHKTSVITSAMVGAISEKLQARQDLLLSLRVKVDLPKDDLPDGLQPEVEKVALEWPRFASLRAFELIADNNDRPRPNLRFDPLSRSLTWSGGAMAAPSPATGEDLGLFYSSTMTLTIGQPGEFYRASKEDTDAGKAPSEVLSGEVIVEIRDWLLSGTQIRLYDGTGALCDDSRIRRRTQLKIKFQLYLDDAFSRRIMSPRQHLYFDQVVPDDMRLLDLRTALADRGFINIKDGKPIPTSQEFEHYLVAWRPEGPDTLALGLVLEGTSVSAERESRIPGGQRYTSQFQSGELILYMVGELPAVGKVVLSERARLEPGNPGNIEAPTADATSYQPGAVTVLTREMNALQQALRDRFNRLRSRR